MKYTAAVCVSGCAVLGLGIFLLINNLSPTGLETADQVGIQEALRGIKQEKSLEDVKDALDLRPDPEVPTKETSLKGRTAKRPKVPIHGREGFQKPEEGKEEDARKENDVRDRNSNPKLWQNTTPLLNLPEKGVRDDTINKVEKEKSKEQKSLLDTEEINQERQYSFPKPPEIYTRAFTKLDSYLINELPEDFAHIDMIIDEEKGFASVPGTIIIESKALTALRRHLITVKLMLKRYQKLRRNLSSEGSKSDVIPVKNFGKSLVLKILELHHLAENVEPHTNK